MDAVKLVDVEKGLIEGWAIPFGGPMPGSKDLDGEAFTKDTELYLDNYPSRPILYQHGKDSLLGYRPIASEVKVTRKEQGIWLEAQLKMAGQYKDMILELLGKEMLGFSSGANIGSVAKTTDGLITSWLWNETSLTPMPANPFGMVTMKALGQTEPMPVSAQMQLCEKLGHFPDAGEVAVWIAEHGKSDKAAFSDDMLERFVRLETNFWNLQTDIHDIKRTLNPDEYKSMQELREENKRLMEAANVTS